MLTSKWWDVSWNPITGCSPASPGCMHCWAERFAHRFYSQQYGPDYFKPRFHPERLNQPLHWRKPRRVFVCDMGDLFHPSVTTDWYAEIIRAMEKAPQHTYYLLTKRPDLMELAQYLCGGLDKENLWLGGSAENQEWADKRIPILLQIPAAYRFISLEPLLGPVDITEWLEDGIPTGEQVDGPLGMHYIRHGAPRLDLVILGAETGPGARPMNLDWARSVRDQCKAAGVPFFFKSAGPKVEIPDDLMVREFPC